MSNLNGTQYDTTLDYFQVACAAIAVYNGCEILTLAFTSFSTYNNLYFRSILGCAIGCILFTGGFLDLLYALYVNDGVTVYRPLFILTFGWYGMVTGFSLVMYSRLHLIQVPQKYVRLVGFLIVYNILFSHLPTTVLLFGANIARTDEWILGYSIMEKIEMTSFCIQEVILGSLYLIFTRRIAFGQRTKPLVRQALGINVIVLCLDILMPIIEYINPFPYQIMLKVVVYSFKLKLIFYVLNLLSRSVTDLASRKHPNHAGSTKPGPTPIDPRPSPLANEQMVANPQQLD